MKKLATSSGAVSETVHNKPLNVLLVGNNPIVLGDVYKNLKNLKDARFIIDFCFDFRKSIMKALKARPHIILLDDAINKKIIKKFIDRINSHKKTRDIPITLLKSSNYNEVVTSGVQEYLLKENLSSDRLYHAILNTIRFNNRTVRWLKVARRRKRRQLAGWFETVKDSLR